MFSTNNLSRNGIFLRVLLEQDVTDDYLAWLHSPVVVEFLEIRHSPPISIDCLKAFVHEMLISENTILMGVFLEHNAKHIGNVKIGPINRYHDSADLGFLIGDRSQWGKGYATVAVQLAVEYAFSSLSVVKLTAGCYAKNEGSRRVLLKAGFSEEGRRISQVKANGQRQDILLFGMVNPCHSQSMRIS